VQNNGKDEAEVSLIWQLGYIKATMAYAKYTTKYNGRSLVVGFWLRISVYTL